MSDEPLLKLENVSKEFAVSGKTFLSPKRTLRAVDNVSFEVRRGETLALVGESGCGKTTTAWMILKLLEPTSGRILFDGNDISTLKKDGLRQYRRRVQAVFQDPWGSLDPRMRVRKIVAEPLIGTGENLTQGERDRRVDEALDVVGIGAKQGNKFPHEFSGGQRQRIAIASALVSQPDLIVLDEPISGLDVSIRAQMMNLLKDLQQQYGCAYVMIAHDLGTTRYMADWLGVMYLGRCVEMARSEDIFEQTSHPYTQALFSAALPSHPRDVGETIVLSGEVPSPMSPPSGCAFHPRCHKNLGAVCEGVKPEHIQFADNAEHEVACHLYDESGVAVRPGAKVRDKAHAVSD